MAAGNLVWVDLEMTGLDPARHLIVEIASLVTDAHLEILAEGPVLAIRRSEEELATLDDWSRATHTRSGLLARVRDSAVDIAEAEQQTMEFVRRWVGERASPLCGNSVHHDRLFLRKEMPALHAYLHYRIVDVSSIKEVVERWYPSAMHAPPKRGAHRALEDIRDSVAELRWYRDRVFVPPAGAAGPSPQAPPS